MDKKVFRIGQLVYAVISAELLGLAIKGVTIVPVSIVSQTDKGVYGIKIYTYSDSIVIPMEIDRLFGSIAEANESQMARLNTISADLKSKDSAREVISEWREEAMKATEVGNKKHEELDKIINELD